MTLFNSFNIRMLEFLVLVVLKSYLEFEDTRLSLATLNSRLNKVSVCKYVCMYS